MTEAQAKFIARIWTTGEFRSCSADNSTATAVIRRGWMDPTGNVGTHLNFDRTRWTGYLPSKAGLAALATYLSKTSR